jgi:hypothetical protein
LVDTGGQKKNLDAVPPVIMYEFPHSIFLVGDGMLFVRAMAIPEI